MLCHHTLRLLNYGSRILYSVLFVLVRVFRQNGEAWGLKESTSLGLPSVPSGLVGSEPGSERGCKGLAGRAGRTGRIAKVGSVGRLERLKCWNVEGVEACWSVSSGQCISAGDHKKTSKIYKNRVTNHYVCRILICIVRGGDFTGPTMSQGKCLVEDTNLLETTKSPTLSKEEAGTVTESSCSNQLYS